MDYQILFDIDFDEYAWEVELKGWFDVPIKIDTRVIQISFYDPARLAQEVADAVATNEIFFDRNLVVISKITRVNIEKAIDYLNISGRLLILGQ